MGHDSNLPAGAEEDPNAPFNDDSIDCPDCNGEGIFNESECCGAEIKWTDICSECLEHCDESECETCDGTGDVSERKYKANL